MSNRVAVVGGIRTPFVKAAGVLSKYSSLDLGSHVVTSLVKKLNLDPLSIDELIFSTVLLDPRVPNLAREIVLRSGLPKTMNAHFISNNCISGLVAATFASDAIRTGRCSVMLAGGVESMSNPALTFSRGGERFFIQLSRARSFSERLKILVSFRPGFLAPVPPSPKEPSTGLTMGQHCELMAQEFEVSRLEQDAIALRSHQSASAAISAGHIADQIEPVGKVDKDNLVRADTTAEKLAKLPAVFEKSAKGTISAGNASALTDGASVICLMSEEIARQQGREVLGYIEAVEFAAVPPGDGLLMAPGLAVPRLLAKLKIASDDVGVWEIHEAFGAQVAANMRVWEQGWRLYPDLKPIGHIPQERINILGGSIALGHPFAATGGRLILSATKALKLQNAQRAVISVCAAGGMGCAMSITRE